MAIRSRRHLLPFFFFLNILNIYVLFYVFISLRVVHMAGQKINDIVVFDKDPIHLFAFRQIVSGSRSAHLSILHGDDEDLWKKSFSAGLIMLNMDCHKHCSHFLLHNILASFPASPVVCYSARRRNLPVSFENFSHRIDSIYQEEVVVYLQRAIGVVVSDECAGGRSPDAAGEDQNLDLCSDFPLWGAYKTSGGCLCQTTRIELLY